ncbi:hypothetical protein EVAR_19139_1 [Eumeta japonica]|uniref:Uncharacterized protein n=1 Tax=Eumeta variegata TaxID=151549 RepID=A0A4C1VNM2_EUMVA|nr:hypothetical protein EVAR_19139_1 [Eumeta japonica]
MTSQTTLIASPSAAGRHMRVPTARDMRYGRRLVEVVSAWDVAGNRHGSVPFPLPGRRRLAAAGWSKELRWIGKYVSWPTDKMGGMRRLIVNRRAYALGCDPAMSKNRFDASFIYLEIVGSSKSLWRIELRTHQCASVAALQNLFCITCSLCSAFERRERRRETRMSSPS